MIYGGNPDAWWQMTPFRLAGFLINRSKVEAYESLRRVGELMVANPDYKAGPREQQMAEWREIAGIKPRPKTMAQKLAELQQMGIDVEVVH